MFFIFFVDDIEVSSISSIVETVIGCDDSLYKMCKFVAQNTDANAVIISIKTILQD